MAKPTNLPHTSGSTNTGEPVPPRQIDRDELQERMEALGLTPYALAKELGVTPQAMYYWLDGERPIPVWLDLALQTVERAEA